MQQNDIKMIGSAVAGAIVGAVAVSRFVKHRLERNDQAVTLLVDFTKMLSNAVMEMNNRGVEIPEDIAEMITTESHFTAIALNEM
jgi:hypothetical protein